VKIDYQEFLIRDWQPGDRPVVADLVKTVLAEYGMGFEPDHTDWDAVQVEKAYWDVGGEFWVAEKEDEIVGCGGFHPVDRGEQSVELRKMFLRPDVRGRGLGRFLLAQLEDAARAKGFKQMWLETATVLDTAVRLYEQNGYSSPSNNAGGWVERCDRLYVKNLSLESVRIAN
jgi:putative acetyltransferase